ncbi:MAG: molybdopterin molybdotransferase MoeA [Alphaproteobacteria bacterium]|nr:molybdopterin molybdotransferase MoeA [Alphaproteobacteria bacterium]
MSDTVPNDCFAPSAGLMQHGEAVGLLKSRIIPVGGVEAVALSAAGGRILAEEICAPYDVPRHTNAAVDGYAFAASDYSRTEGTSFALAGRAAAGHPLQQMPGTGEAVRILTGAVLPEGVDTVAMQEDVEISGDAANSSGPRVRIPGGLKPGANVRKAGEDVRAGHELFSNGHLLRPQDLAALASIGRGIVSCSRRLRVGIVSSGDEVIRAGQRELGIGEVYDANAPMLEALVRLTGAEAIDLGIWPDRRDEVTSRLAEAANSLDVIITSGGASLGEEDHMSAALGMLGSCHFWRIAVKPGRPMMFGQIGSATMIGLPGNPVAVFVCFLMYVYPLLRRSSGAAWPEPRRFMLPAAFEFANRKLGRREFWRASLIEGPNGLMAEKFARDGSGLISGLRAADGLIEVGEDVPAVARGDAIAFIPFSEFGILGR